MRNRAQRLFFPAAFILLILLVLMGIRNSADGRTWHDTINALFGFGSDDNLKYFIYHLRLPRIAGAVATGAALAVSGSGQEWW